MSNEENAGAEAVSYPHEYQLAHPDCMCVTGPVMRRDCPEHGPLVRSTEAREQAEKEMEHCRDCCCARAWAALGVTGYTGKSIVEHITELRTAAKQEGWLNEFHRLNAARQHEAFAPAHSLQALVNCVAEEVGELAGAVSGVTGEKKRKAHLTNADVLDAVADAITYLSLVADRAGCSDIEGLIAFTFNMVSDRAGSLIKVRLPRRIGD